MEDIKHYIKLYNDEQYDKSDKLPSVNKSHLVSFIINMDNDRIFPSHDEANNCERQRHNNLKNNGMYPVFKNGKISQSGLYKFKKDKLAEYVFSFIQGNSDFVAFLFIK